jgi:HD-GYP domain-containing protein (c-di-GMP phosphodiesterase class II)
VLREESVPTQDHCEHVAVSARLARARGWPAARVALLHDVGKIGVPDTILLKDGPPEEDEYAVVREPTRGTRWSAIAPTARR